MPCWTRGLPASGTPGRSTPSCTVGSRVSHSWPTAETSDELEVEVDNPRFDLTLLAARAIPEYGQGCFMSGVIHMVSTHSETVCGRDWAAVGVFYSPSRRGRIDFVNGSEGAKIRQVGGLLFWYIQRRWCPFRVSTGRRCAVWGARLRGGPVRCVPSGCPAGSRHREGGYFVAMPVSFGARAPASPAGDVGNRRCGHITRGSSLEMWATKFAST